MFLIYNIMMPIVVHRVPAEANMSRAFYVLLSQAKKIDEHYVNAMLIEELASMWCPPCYFSLLYSPISLSLPQTQVSLKPFRIVEPRVRQLANTVVPRSLVALQQHQENIARHLAERDWDRVNTEQINAARTAQVCC